MDKSVFIPKHLRANKNETSTEVERLSFRPKQTKDEKPILVENSSVRDPPRTDRNNKRLKFEWSSWEDTSSIEPSILDIPSPFIHSRARKDPLDNFDSSAARDPSLVSLDEMTTKDWRIYREMHGIHVKASGDILPPIREWNESLLSPILVRSILDDAGYEEPTSIQRQTIPIILQGRDLLGLAETGSGKTAAFVIPLLDKVSQMPRISGGRAQDGPYVLVVAPTRELCLQICAQFVKFGKQLGIRTLSIIGGHSITEQSMDMRDGIEVIVGTPGRLRDCYEQHVLSLNQCQFVVLDEADRMVEGGFDEDLHFLLSKVQITRQMAMFSATMSSAVGQLIKRYLKDFVTVKVGSGGDSSYSMPNANITQCVELLDPNGKMNRLMQVLHEQACLHKAKCPSIIFANSRDTVDYLVQQLNKKDWRVSALHGGMSQDRRERALDGFRSGHIDVLVATDVAARGLDIPDVQLVINYEMPASVQTYLHRIGRTGRAGRSGIAVTLLTDDDRELFWELRNILDRCQNVKVSKEFSSHPSAQSRFGIEPVKKRNKTIIYRT